MRSVAIVSVLLASALVTGCAVKQMPAASSPPPPGGNPPPPGYGPQPPSKSYNIGGFEVSKRFFWMGLAAATLGTAAFMDNVPFAAKDGDLTAYDFFPIGLYTLGGGFFIGGAAQ